jgi:hypothetical protein
VGLTSVRGTFTCHWSANAIGARRKCYPTLSISLYPIQSIKAGLCNARRHSNITMWLFIALALFGACYAQSDDEIPRIGGSNPTMTFPAVNGYSALNGKYQHVIILSIDGLHTVLSSTPNGTDYRLISKLMYQ